MRKEHSEYIDSKIKYLRKLAEESNEIYPSHTKSIKIPLDKPEFYGLRYKCVLKEFANLRLGEAAIEAVNACGMWILFSGNEPRRCNMKANNFSNLIDEDSFFYPNKWYKKGELTFVPLCECEYKKLSDSAKKFFISRRVGFDWEDKPIMQYYCIIPASYTKNICEKIYVVNKALDKSEERSRYDWIKNHTNDMDDIYWYWGQNNTYDRWEKYSHKYERRRIRHQFKNELDNFYEEEW